ncbi:HK97 family phage prohead protease [Paenibacillus melissococcoides]|uniref:HK97 family phage prohead protease n=3 Tax=Paenibacillus melissococcoides TaxID=2912268 RepID=A0ABM9GDX2_9BACL|nr:MULTISPECIES: HK97 family phage prohead protease [Paenibacillus]MEB9894867.1 HK97 family phage prohead protease [Bacillus cereus]CAH8247370.1 HK97 family phage prohead protease [Paenibacillus melissococcoides]CAH8248434.1 HK97 family phage prohead protease [Paenibacillus melissococcoides]CAH8249466.1 HK97 family phage prohead protease [Paenibacillus melissococcoides]CAH8249724.1 HK97 family phage prohead protease [Paenibacillus melissococcoides]
MEKERRMLTNKVELRADNEESAPRIVGYGLRFNVWSQDLGGFVERIDPKAINEADMSDVRCLIDHESGKVLGRTTSGTLRLAVDDFGLRYEVDPPDTTYASDLIKVMKRGDINQSSFAFRIDYENDGDEWIYDEKSGLYNRTIRKIKRVFDVSVVTYAAYVQAESLVSNRSLECYQNELRRKQEQEKLLLEIDLLGI